MLVVVEAQESNLHEPLPPENHPYDFTTKGGHCDFRILKYINMSDRKKQPPIIQNLTARLVSAAPRWVLLSMKKNYVPPCGTTRIRADPCLPYLTVPKTWPRTEACTSLVCRRVARFNVILNEPISFPDNLEAHSAECHCNYT
jgi:hypothetical protein